MDIPRAIVDFQYRPEALLLSRDMGEMTMCDTIANWLCDWEAWSALGTIGATIVALFLPRYMTRQEWARQDRLRQEDIAKAQSDLAATQHEACSAVDCVLAYREAAMALFDSQPVYWVGIRAIKKINLNASILQGTLSLLERRPELSDGALYATVAAQRIADATIRETTTVLESFGQHDPGWPARKAALVEFEELSAMVATRTAGVREHFDLAASQRAADIRSKYVPLAAAIAASMANDSGEPPNNLADDFL